jgi:hypothetical protein
LRQDSIPRPEHVHLQHLEDRDVLLVPLDGVAVLHRRLRHDGEFRQPAPRDDEAPDMGREVAREAVQLLRQLHGHREPRIRGIQADLPHEIAVLPEVGVPHALREPPVTSSDRPIALPTSRIAERER